MPEILKDGPYTPTFLVNKDGVLDERKKTHVHEYTDDKRLVNLNIRARTAIRKYLVS